MTLNSVLSALEAAPFATAISQGSLAFPWIESIHVLAIVTVVGVVVTMDLALLGFGSHTASLRRLLQESNIVTWGAFAVALVTGFLLFSSAATGYAANPAFQIKFAAMALAGVNMLLFHLASARQGQAWESLPQPPARAKIAGLISLSCWIVVVGAGRWIGFLT
jgi:hypothetical protein